MQCRPGSHLLNFHRPTLPALLPSSPRNDLHVSLYHFTTLEITPFKSLEKHQRNHSYHSYHLLILIHLYISLVISWISFTSSSPGPGQPADYDLSPERHVSDDNSHLPKPVSDHDPSWQTNQLLIWDLHNSLHFLRDHIALLSTGGAATRNADLDDCHAA